MSNNRNNGGQASRCILVLSRVSESHGKLTVSLNPNIYRRVKMILYGVVNYANGYNKQKICFYSSLEELYVTSFLQIEKQGCDVTMHEVENIEEVYGKKYDVVHDDKCVIVFSLSVSCHIVSNMIIVFLASEQR